MATGKYPRQPFADEGLPQDWGEPEEMPEVNDYLGPAPWAFGNWRFVVVELTADERVMLTKLAREQRRDTDAMAAALIRQGLRKKGPGSRGQGPGEERSSLEPGTWPLEPASAVGGRPSAVVPYEYLLLDSAGRILEGTGTNFWAVRDGVMYTAGEGVLEGITREILLQLIAGLGIPLRLEAVGAADVATLDEAALSGSSRALLPVVSIAGQTVGDGRPGPIVGRVLAAYNAFVAENVRTAM